MKLLFDENLSRKLPKKLVAEFPNSEHVIFCGLERANDQTIRQHALDHGFMIVTRDKDFSLLTAAIPNGPKVVWLRRANASTSEYMRLLVSQKEQIEAFAVDPQRPVLIIY